MPADPTEQNRLLSAPGRGAYSKFARWDFWAVFFAVPATPLVIAIPILGYAFIFNDAVAALITFDQLTDRKPALGWVTDHRLVLMYYGLVFMGLAGALYRLRRPQALSVAKRASEYVEKGETRFSPIQLSEALANVERHGQATAVEAVAEATFAAYRVTDATSPERPPVMAWERMKQNDRPLLLALLHANFMIGNTSRPVSLYACVGLAAAGYLAFGLSSLDIFWAVTVSQIF